MQVFLPQSNWVLGSHLDSMSSHCFSSLPSVQSAFPLQCRCPEMQLLSLHWNWSALQVTFKQFVGDSSEPSGQSLSPSQSQFLWMQESWSPQSNSLTKQNDGGRGLFGQFWRNNYYEVKNLMEDIYYKPFHLFYSCNHKLHRISTLWVCNSDPRIGIELLYRKRSVGSSSHQIHRYNRYPGRKPNAFGYISHWRK